MSNYNDQIEMLEQKLFLRDNEVDFLNNTLTSKLITIISLNNKIRELESKSTLELLAENKRQKIDLARQKREILRVKQELCELKKV